MQPVSVPSLIYKIALYSHKAAEVVFVANMKHYLHYDPSLEHDKSVSDIFGPYWSSLSSELANMAIGWHGLFVKLP